jgi:hypothetical protein
MVQVKSSDATFPSEYCSGTGTFAKATYELDSAVESETDGKVPYSADAAVDVGGDGVSFGADADRSRMTQTTMIATRITIITAPTDTPTINALSGGLLKVTAA